MSATERGPRGERGQRGEPGPARLSPKVSRALVALFVLPSGIAVAAVVGEVVHDRAQQQAQARQARITEQKICQTLAALAKQKPPPGDPAINPSRAYLQEQYATLNQLGPDLGCESRRP